jgi:hypothetical protein
MPVTEGHCGAGWKKESVSEWGEVLRLRKPSPENAFFRKRRFSGAGRQQSLFRALTSPHKASVEEDMVADSNSVEADRT